MAIAATMPAISHVAVTVADLDVSEAWYTKVLGVTPILDEDTGPFRHIVFLLGNTLFGLHGFPRLVRYESFDERRPGLDHIAFGVTSRDELVEWAERLDALDVPHGDVVDAAYGSGLAFRDPDNIQLELFAPPA
jgi:glyoxylase I family protein